MAQKVITLANQETSDAILQKVTSIESKNNTIENLARGGYDHIAVKAVTNGGSITVNGNADIYIAITGQIPNSPNANSLPTYTLNIDGVSMSAPFLYSACFSGLHCRNKLTLTVTHGNDKFYMRAQIVAYFYDSTGSIS